jgi:Mg2+ and Co2+ transporter CorA
MIEQMKRDIAQLERTVITLGNMVVSQSNRITQLEDELITINRIQMETVDVIGNVTRLVRDMDICQ